MARSCFFGYIETANPFTSIQFSDSAASDTFGFDDAIVGVRQGTTTPEPASYLLFGTGILGVLLGRKEAVRNLTQ